MNIHEKLGLIMKDLNLDKDISFLKDNLLSHVDRLYQLLWGFNGPFADGYQLQDWVSVSLLLGNWIVEVLNDVNKNKRDYNKIRDFLGKNPGCIAQIVCDIAYEIVNNDLLPMDPQAKIVAKFILSSKTLVPTIMEHVDTLLNIIEEQCCCCMFKKSNKSIKYKIQSLTKKQSKRSRGNAEIMARLI
jgi:hypothetical protein